MEKLERTLSKMALMELEKEEKKKQLEKLERATFNAIQRNKEQMDEMNTSFNKGRNFRRQEFGRPNTGSYSPQQYRSDGSMRTSWVYRGNGNFRGRGRQNNNMNNRSLIQCNAIVEN
jgi:hypothetical protein